VRTELQVMRTRCANTATLAFLVIDLVSERLDLPGIVDGFDGSDGPRAICRILQVLVVMSKLGFRELIYD
jgi:hypothetical protein